MIVGLILIYTLFSCVFSYTYKLNNNLSCGLFGALGPNIDSGKVNLLGILNEERGDKSAGLLIGNTLFKVLDKYRELVKTAKFTKSKFILGHTRNPSVGNVTYDNAQPLQNNKIALVHNGTIKNMNYLLDMYNIENTDLTLSDSNKILLLISNEVDKNWLNLYEGTAALIVRNNNKVSFWVGQSDEEKVERPLHYFYQGKTMYFSSEEEHLSIIAGENKILKFEPNTWMTYDLDANLISSEVFDRLNPTCTVKNNLNALVDARLIKYKESAPAGLLYFNCGRYMFNGTPYTGNIQLEHHSQTFKFPIGTHSHTHYCFQGIILDKLSNLDIIKNIDLSNISNYDYLELLQVSNEYTLLYDDNSGVLGKYLINKIYAEGIFTPNLKDSDSYVFKNGILEKVITDLELKFINDLNELIENITDFAFHYQDYSESSFTLCYNLQNSINEYEEESIQL